MHIKEAIILAGGQGTRLRTAVPDLPKCMAPVAGKPFISYLINYLINQQVERFIFALGYKHEIIETFLHNSYPSLNILYSVEPQPLGTGGAVRLAINNSFGENLLILNGDTFFNVDCKELASLHTNRNASCTLSLKPMRDIDRFGVVELNEDQSVSNYRERKFYQHGLINGGVYALNRNAFERAKYPEVFSFEKEYLQKQTGNIYSGSSHSNQGGERGSRTQGPGTDSKIFGLIQDNYFIDIGIPDDFERAQAELPANTGY